MKPNLNHRACASFKPVRGVLRPLVAAVLGLAAAMGPGSALADASTAKTSFFANMSQAGVVLPVNASTARIAPVYVKGMYRIDAPDGTLVAYTNEAGTIAGKKSGFSIVGLQPGKPRPMTPKELAGLRAEVMANLEYDKLIKIAHGNGGGRRILMFSAVDCPGCNHLEKGLHKVAPDMNTTYYVIAGSLVGRKNGGLPALEKVARIRCADNPGLAWQEYWTKRSVPPARACALTPESADVDFYSLFAIMQGVKAIKPLVPMMIGEDGKALPAYQGMPAETAAHFAPERKPAVPRPSSQWLAAALDGKPAQTAPASKAR
ncbi:hypothetical protein RBA41_06410 [Massilia sp. CCM 9210]|uniref:hypothetical protein n=1 Tax=Massilia scottii TaxID=3057166 RepID=UPI002796D32F|nr:hypothetical protein [Massilia sp. CCM 9210]MDQ1812934.1 hypothetical protein [Massilia sp. CCM 9210]